MGSAKSPYHLWRCRPASGSALELVLAYLEQAEKHPIETKSEMIANALVAYYLPWAVEAANRDGDRRVLERAAWEAIFALLRQADRVGREFKLDTSADKGILPLLPVCSMAKSMGMSLNDSNQSVSSEVSLDLSNQASVDLGMSSSFVEVEEDNRWDSLGVTSFHRSYQFDSDPE